MGAPQSVCSFLSFLGVHVIFLFLFCYGIKAGCIFSFFLIDFERGPDSIMYRKLKNADRFTFVGPQMDAVWGPLKRKTIF